MDFTKDDLGRQKFADLLVGYATSLASAAVSPAGRVIAVDAPWGTGKSWIAKRLPEHLRNDSRVGQCVYVDAFQFDYHQDPFAVVTSAILEASRVHAVEASNLKDAAIKVLKVSLPAIGKGLVRVGGRAFGVDTDDLMAAAIDASGEASEKVIAQMLESFAQTTATTEIFKKKLSELATANPQNAPLIVVIDELDRCRPSYALEMLERVKHLFDVPNVVFIFFIHSPALHSAIKKTYGSDINPSEYLKKFFSLTVGLPIADRPTYQYRDQSQFIAKFIESTFGGTNSPTEYEFRSSLAALAPIFDASFRDIESALLLWQIAPNKDSFDPHMYGYALLLKLKKPEQLAALRIGTISSFVFEVQRLKNAQHGNNRIAEFMRDVFIYGSEPETYEATDKKSLNPSERTLPAQHARGGLQDFQRLIANLSLEYVRV